ncbi:MAG: ABC transporter ATP-binding protein [Candidatus Omnitrophota bacterium]
MIEIIELCKNFGKKQVLNGVNLKVKKGETFALIGASGKGKSVLLKHIIGLIKPDQGKILIDGHDISGIHGTKLKKLKDRFGVVFQFGALFDSLTVYDNVAFPLIEKTRLSPDEIHKKVLEELATVGLSGEEDKYPAQISGGMRKRVAVARCLVMNPEIILFDEPTTGLDPVIANSIYRTIKKLQDQRNLTSFIISHEIPGIFKIADRVAMLHDGQIIQVGTSDEIQNTQNTTVKKFLQGEIE